MHYQRAALRLERTALIVADISRKYDPDQPRIAAGSPSGGQWGLGGYARDAVGHLREASNRVAAIAQSLAAYPSEQALNIYNALAAANNAQQQAIIIFGAPGPAAPVPGNPRPLVHVGDVPQEAARVLCPRMSEVQNRVDLAAQWVTRKYTGLSPQQYGTAVHYNVHQQIRSLNNPNFRSEVSPTLSQ